MAERICAPGGDCLQYCRALDSISGFNYAPQDGQPCAWPQEMDKAQGPVRAEYPNNRLLFTLGRTLAETLDANAETDDPLAEAAQKGYEAISAVFQQQVEMWLAIRLSQKVTQVKYLYVPRT